MAPLISSPVVLCAIPASLPTQESGRGTVPKNADWLWPNNKRIAVVFNVCLEAWSDGKAPGISPMGNPLPHGVLDTMAISWAAYGVKSGIYRILDGFARHRAKASVLTNANAVDAALDAV